MLLFRLFEEAAKGTDWTSLIFIGVMLVVMVLLFIIPQRRNKKKAQEMMSNLKIGSKITTIGGIIGEVIEINEPQNYVVVETGDAEHLCHIKFTKNAIYYVMPETQPAVANKEDSKEEYNEIKG